jgi:toxin ParE1/3/4
VPTIELSAAAAKDIEAILDQSVAEFGLLRAEEYYESLKRCLELLSENPGMGSTAERVRPGYRRFSHESHVVFSRVSEGGILVIRVLHARMDVGRHF